MGKFVLGLSLGFLAFLIPISVGGLLDKVHVAPAKNSSVVLPADRPPDYLLINGERWFVIPGDFSEYDKEDKDKITDGLTSCSERKIWYTIPPVPSPELRDID